jgi:hypothetical protein
MNSPNAGLLAALGGAFLVTGCTTFITQAASDKVIGRYQTDQCTAEVDGQRTGACRDTMPTASVSVITIATPGGGSVAPTEPPAPGAAAAPAPASTTAASGPSSPPTGLNLSDRGQAAYLNLLADPKKVKSMAALRKSFAAAIQTDTPEVPQDLTVFHRTMIVVVARDPKLFNPADRLEDVDVLIRPTNAVIQSWDTAATLYSTINAGSVALTGTQTANVGATIGTPATAPVSASITGGYSQGLSRVETLNANEQTESLTISLKNNDAYNIPDCVSGPICPSANVLRIHRQGGIGVDLTGSIVLKIDVALPATPSGTPLMEIEPRRTFTIDGDYFDKKGNPVKAASLTIKPHLMLMAHAAGSPAIVGNVDLVYTLRHVTNGDDTLEEKDDVVTERTVTVPEAPIVLIPASEVDPRLYSIHSAKDAQMMVQRRQGAGPEPFCFKSLNDANDLVTYLQHAKSPHPERIGRDWVGFSTLDLRGRLQMLSPADVDNLYVIGECKG